MRRPRTRAIPTRRPRHHKDLTARGWTHDPARPRDGAPQKCARASRSIIPAPKNRYLARLAASTGLCDHPAGDGAVIEFYAAGDEFGELSNFAPFPITLKGKRWPTSEHYFQAQKFAGTPHEDEIRYAKKPRLAAEMGRDRKRPLRRDWESIKDSVMLDALRAKFTQHADLRALLLSTGAARLVEHTHNDSYWGDGGDGSGTNRLGQLLMRVRDELRALPR